MVGWTVGGWNVGWNYAALPLITPQNAQNRELSPFRSSEEPISTLHADHPHILPTPAGLPQ